MGIISTDQIGGSVQQVPSSSRLLLSVVTPAFNEADNLPAFYERLRKTMQTVDMDWEWLIVDDHSRDTTFELISDLARRDPRVKGVRFSRNFGAHTALTCGLHKAQGDCVAAMAADLQDPPEFIPALLTEWRNGTQVVWAARHERQGETAATIGLARLYYWVMRNVVGMKEMPAMGADFFLLDRQVAEAFSSFSEANVSILALITWMGFRQAVIPYDKEARLHGRSGWNLKKKLKLVVDSVTSFSYVPIRFMSYLGFVFAFLGFVYAGVVIFNAIHGAPIQGWSSLMVVVLLVGGLLMLMMGILGEYLWRALDESRRRPRYIVEATTADDLTSQRRGRSLGGSSDTPTRRGPVI
jgi:glycosyltransferase involved in cell wall biosynthesis